MRTLFPTDEKPERKLPEFAVCDIEAANWIEFLVIGYYRKIKDKETGLKLDEVLEYFKDMNEFISWCFEETQEHKVIFAHFGGKYDFLFILKEFCEQHEAYVIHDMIPRGSGLLCFSASTFELHDVMPILKDDKDFFGKTKDGKLKIKKKTIEFHDSSALLPFGLRNLSENFNVDHKKGDFDFERLKEKPLPQETWDELIEYLESDLKGLYEVMEKFYTQPVIRKAGYAKTVASQSMKVFQNYLKKNIPSLDDGIDSYVRESYFGGRTEIFKPFFKQRSPDEILKTYDVNSLYPFVMMNHNFPGKFIGEVPRYNEDFYAFYDCEVEIPEMYIPPLGYIHDKASFGKLIFPTGIVRGKWSTLELNYAMTLGVKILKIYSGLRFANAGPIFADYVKDLYAMRKKAKKNSVDDIIAKLLMNSLYGRFGLRREREQLEFENGQGDVISHLEVVLDNGMIRRIAKKEIVLDESFVNVAIPAWVTSAGRIHIHKQYMQAPDKVFYTDTDSLFSTHDYPESAKEIGELKLEDKAKAACFLLPKTYLVQGLMNTHTAYDSETGKPLIEKVSKKTVMKGFDRRKISHFQLEDFHLALEGDLRMMKSSNPERIATFKTALKSGKFLHMIKEAPREIRSRYDKRRILNVEGGHGWDSEPLHVKDGIIVNMVDEKISNKFKKELFEKGLR